MFRKLKQKFSVLLAKKPATVVLMAILLLNIAFVLVSAAIIGTLAVSGTENMSFWQAAYYTITMILDAGCISSVVQDIGTAGVALVIICLVVIVIGMVLFTGAVIGYLTNYISNFIENANVGTHKLNLSGHTVVLNWNTRASEIINDMLYNDGKQYVVVLVSSGKEEIERELSERLAETIAMENAIVREKSKQKRSIVRPFYRIRHRFRNNIVFIVREGDTFSTKQLTDISLCHAKSIIILGNDINNSVCKYDVEARQNSQNKGNPQTIKALVQVAEITSAETSDDNQKIVVEVEDDWTLELVNKIIEHKQVDGKCNIVPISVNRILGRLLSQFSLMPELNLTYKELFSNKGMTFYSKPYAGADERAFTSVYLGTHNASIPICIMKSDKGTNAFFAAESKKDDTRLADIRNSDYRVKLNYNYTIEKKNIIILGHNSKIKDIMDGFDSFRDEWNPGDGSEIMNVVIIDDKTHLERMDYYKAYPYVSKVVEAEIYDRDLICQTIEQTVLGNETDTSILVLSDDTVINEQIDTNAIANLIYVSDIILKVKSEKPDFDLGKFDVIVEILNPKHYDIIKSYSINNVVISNRYISKMITQLGEKDTLYDFYNDILSYDSADTTAYESKEIYAKKVSRYFEEVPAPTTAGDLIRAVYKAAVDDAPGAPNHTIVLGYVNKDGKMTLFSGNQFKQNVTLTDKDKLIVYSAH